MKTRIIAICNHKGGVGKSSSAASIGSILAGMGRSVLLVDLDAQANLTSSFMAEEPEATIYASLKDGKPLKSHHLRENLDLVASTLDMAGIELELNNRMNRERILRNLLKPVADKYDYILLDCPPSLGLVTINALTAANELFIPLTAEALPSKGLAKLTHVLQMVRENLNEKIRLTGIIITRWEGTKLSKMVEDNLRATFGATVFKTRIRKNVSIAEAPLYAKDIVSYAPDSNGAADYMALSEEIVEQEPGTEGITFAKHFGEGYGDALGILTGEPNEDGEQDYRGFSILASSIGRIADGEDFLTEDEVKDLKIGDSTVLQRVGKASLLKMETLYRETEARLQALGCSCKESLSMDEAEGIEDEAKRDEAKAVLHDAIRKAQKLALC